LGCTWDLCALILFLLSPADVAARGRIETVSFDSPTMRDLGFEEELRVYLPPGYDDGPWSYPVIYGLAQLGDLLNEADRLITAGDMNPLIIVEGRIDAYSDTHVFDELLPFVDQHFRTLRLRHHRLIYGWSRSANAPMRVATARPNLFGMIGLFDAGDNPVFDEGYAVARYPMRAWLYSGQNIVSPGDFETLGWDYVNDTEGTTHLAPPDSRERFLLQVSRWMNDVPLVQSPRWTLTSDEPLIAGTQVQFRAAVYPGLARDGTHSVPVSVDLSGLGGPANAPLSPDADGVYRAAARIDITSPHGLAPVVFSFDQADGAPTAGFEIVDFLPVFAGQDWILFADDAPLWEAARRVTIDPDATAEVFEGSSSLSVEAKSGFSVDWVPPAPVASLAFQTLRFAFHPGDVESGALEVTLAGSAIGRLPVAVDLEPHEWQSFEVPIISPDPNDIFQKITFSGGVTGTFYLDDIRLVRSPPEPLYRLASLPTQDLAVLEAGPPASLRVEVVLETPLERSPPSLSLDLSALGETDAVPLVHEGNGRYTARPRITPPEHNSIHRLPLMMTTEAGEQELFFNLRLRVLPANDQVLFSDDEAPHWEALSGSLDPLATEQIYKGATSLAVIRSSFTDRFKSQWVAPEPVGPFGYRLHFAFHPGDLESLRAFEIRIVGDAVKTVDFVDDNPDNPGVDLTIRDWQVVEIPLHLLDPTVPLESVEFGGTADGTFYLDDIRLVAETPPPITAVLEEHQPGGPSDFALSQNYPNPFNSSTTIRFDLPQTGEVNLAVYNLTGQKVATLAHGNRQPGSYTLQWDGRDEGGRELASGMYIFRLSAGDERVETRKMALIK